MDASVTDAILSWILVYSAIGVAFGAYFMVRGARQMDPGHGDSSALARLVLLPGAIALWPFLLIRLLIGAQFEG